MNTERSTNNIVYTTAASLATGNTLHIHNTIVAQTKCTLLKIFHICYNIVHVSAIYVAIFREVIKNELKMIQLLVTEPIQNIK
jgi:hypothetical protein